MLTTQETSREVQRLVARLPPADHKPLHAIVLNNFWALSFSRSVVGSRVLTVLPSPALAAAFSSPEQHRQLALVGIMTAQHGSFFLQRLVGVLGVAEAAAWGILLDRLAATLL